MNNLPKLFFSQEELIQKIDKFIPYVQQPNFQIKVQKLFEGKFNNLFNFSTVNFKRNNSKNAPFL